MSTSTESTETVAEITYTPWPDPNAKHLGSVDGLEPSGLAIISVDDTWYIYMASNNGKIARQESGEWRSQSYGEKNSTDFEALTVAKGKLMVGVEGAYTNNDGGYKRASIKRFDPLLTSTDKPLGDFTGSSWSLGGMPLDDGQGLEALTFIPSSAAPSAWGTADYYGGFFLATTQKAKGKVFVYDLPEGQGESHTVDSYVTSLHENFLPYSIADLHYCASRNILFVLYDQTCESGDADCDGNNGSDYYCALQMMSLDRTHNKFTSISVMRTPYVGFEALTSTDNDLYMGLDQSGDIDPASGQYEANGLTQNNVYKYDQFLVS